MSDPKSPSQKALLQIGLAYLFFVIYGSLVPLDYHYKNWSDALQTFRHIRYLRLAIDSRADWIANILLYIPLTFIWASIAAQVSRKSFRILGLCAVLSAGIALSLAVEFAQIFFPQRTVSLNDIIAETIGSIAGIVLWLAMGQRITRWLSDLRNSQSAGRDAAITGALSLYLLAYLAYSFFPFDFVVSYAELAERMANDQSAWFISSASCVSRTRCAAHVLIDMLAAVPLGVVVVRLRHSVSASRVIVATVMGAMLGMLIEGTQLFLHSGISEGISVISRSIGAGLGAFVYGRLLTGQVIPASYTTRRLRLLAVLLTPIYLLGVVTLQSWDIHHWLGREVARARLSQVHFLPFYYHYFTTETAALASLLRISVSYAPVGMIIWLGQVRREYGMRMSALLAAVLAATFESAKLFQDHLRPDPTNVLIAIAAAASGYALINWWFALHAVPTSDSQKEAAKAENTSPTALVERAHSVQLGRIAPLSLFCIGILAYGIAQYPLGGYWPAGCALIYLAVLRRWPQAWLVAVPALLPVLDLTPWTGHFFLDEFDYLVVATVAIVGWRRPRLNSSFRLSASGFLILALLTLSTVGALFIGCYPFAAVDLNSFSHYYSAYNALRVAKGLLWVLLLMPLLKIELERNSARAGQLFVLGMTLGVFCASVAVLWERAAFAGLLDFSNGYRVVGLFSGMHTGGAYIEGYFATALPFVAYWTLTHKGLAARLVGAAVFAVGCYALMVTYARGGYIALALSMIVLSISLALRHARSLKPFQLIGSAVLLLVLTAIAWPILHGSIMRERFSTTQRDLHIRTAHWEDAIRMMNDDIANKVFGMGLGRYPDTYFWHNAEGVQPATYSLAKESRNIYLMLGAGDALYVEQIVSVQPHQRYHLSLSSKSQSDQAEITVPLCEKWMLYSANCVWTSLHVGNTDGTWRSFAMDIDTDKFSDQAWYAQRTVKLSLINRVAGAALSIDNVSLKSATGIELLKNGDFADEMDHWFFSTDNHLPWHFKNLWLQIYFEQGIFGLFIFGCLLVYTFIVVVKRLSEKDSLMPVIAASLVGFLTVGVVDSLFDFPRMALLFYLIATWALLKKRRRRSSAKSKI